jgi:hypothetical protein
VLIEAEMGDDPMLGRSGRERIGARARPTKEEESAGFCGLENLASDDRLSF